MLILARKVNDTVIVTVPPSTEPRTIEVKVLKGGTVRLGFEADEDISILRSELLSGPGD